MDNRLVSDVSDFPKSVKLERGVVEFVVPDKSERVSLMDELGLTHTILQHRKLQNIALMALWRYFVSSCKGADGLVGGMMSTLLEYSMLCAKPRGPVAVDEKVEFVTIVFLRLTPIDGGPLANFKSALQNDSPVKKNMVVAVARVVDGVIKDTRYSFCGIYIESPSLTNSHPQMATTRHSALAGMPPSSRRRPCCISQDARVRAIRPLYGCLPRKSLV